MKKNIPLIASIEDHQVSESFDWNILNGKVVRILVDQESLRYPAKEGRFIRIRAEELKEGGGIQTWYMLMRVELPENEIPKAEETEVKGES